MTKTEQCPYCYEPVQVDTKRLDGYIETQLPEVSK